MKNFILLPLLFCCIQVNAQYWSQLEPKSASLQANGQIMSIVEDASGNIYAAGYFTDFFGNAVVKWNGTAWTRLGSSSFFNGAIRTLKVDAAGNVYAIGEFKDANNYYYVAKWNGTDWTALGKGTNALNAANKIWAIEVDGSGNVYIGGEDLYGGNDYFVMKWNGTSWSSVGNIIAYNTIYALKLDASGNLYAAGAFTINGKLYVAKWNGKSWAQITSSSTVLNANGSIYSLDFDASGNIYVGGSFKDVTNSYYVAKWDGTSWSSLGNGSNTLYTDGVIRALAVRSGNVYAAGGATVAGSSGAKHAVLKWDGTSWTTVVSNSDVVSMNGLIYSMLVRSSGDIYAAGDFLNNDANYFVAHWSPTGAAPITTVPPVTTATKNSVNATDVKIYPNPSKNAVTITLPEQAEMIVYNLQGEKIGNYFIEANGATVDLSSLSAGMFNLVFVSQNVSYSPVKFIKE